MQAELIDIRNHMAQYPPFDEMADELLDRVVSGIEVVYFKAGTQILEFGVDNPWLFYVRSGAVEIYRRTGELYNRISEGEIFGQFGLLMNKKVRFPAKALEDTLVYKIPGKPSSTSGKTTTTLPISLRLKTAAVCALPFPGARNPTN